MKRGYRMCSIWMSMSQGRSTFFSVFFVVLFFSIALSSKAFPTPARSVGWRRRRGP